MKKIVIGLGLLLVVGGVAFTSLGGASWLGSLGLLGDEQQLRGRIEAYWQARLHNDEAAMAESTHPEQGAPMSPGLLVTESYEILGVEVDGDVAYADVALKTRLKHSVLSKISRDVQVRDRWVRYEGNWYRDKQDLGLAPVLRDNLKWLHSSPEGESNQ